ncbi:MAG: hypothetical protein ACI4L8_09315, partial [Candidatus Fimadaptatus sp.]
MKRDTDTGGVDMRHAGYSGSILNKVHVLMLVILFVFLTYAIGFNFYMTSIIEDNNSAAADTEFSSIMQQVNAQITDLMSVQSILQTDSSYITIYSSTSRGAQNLRQPYVRLLMEKLKNYVDASSNMSGIFVALPTIDMVISQNGQCSMKTFMNTYRCSQLNAVLMDMAEQQGSGIAMGTYTSDYGDMSGNLDVVFHYTKGNNYSVIIIMLSREYLDGKLARLCNGKDVNVYIFAETGELYAQYEYTNGLIDTTTAWMLGENSSTTLNIDDDMYDIRSGASNGLRVVMAYRRNGFSNAMAQNMRVLLLFVAIFVVLVLLLYIAIRRWFYRPLKSILNVHEAEMSAQGNEYARLNQLMDSMHTNMRSLEKRIRESEETARRTASDTLNAMSWEQTRYFVVENEQRYSVFMFVIEDESGALLVSECRKFCLELGKSYNINIVYDHADVFTGVISYADERQVLDRIEMLLKQAGDTNAFVHMGISRSHSDVQHITVASEECRKAFFAKDGRL